jgi:hypothetical protein
MDATSFLHTFDLGCVEELVVWPRVASFGRPSRRAPFLLPGLRPGGPKVLSAIVSLLLREGDCISWSIPVIREQTYQLSHTSFFRVAGLHPDLTASGRHYTPEPKRRKHLVLDPSFPSEARGSGFTSRIFLARLASPDVFRVITIFQTYSLEFLAQCGNPASPRCIPRAPSSSFGRPSGRGTG